MRTNCRVEVRIPSNLTANVRYLGNVHSGEVRNISKRGLYLEAIDITIGTEQNIQIWLAVENELFTLNGDVVWFKALPCKSSQNTLHGIGIRIHEAPAEYLNHVEYLKHLNRFNN